MGLINLSQIKIRELEKLNIPFNSFKNNKKIEYLEVPCAFDIEVSSFYHDKEKAATMYLFAFALGSYVIIGREWAQFIKILSILKHKYDLHKDRRIIIYIHNLSYEFQFMHKWLKWSKVFAIDARQVCYAITEDGFEFRCSYLLSGTKLDNLPELMGVDLPKLSDKFDYDLKRHSKSCLTTDDIKYVTRDVEIVINYIVVKAQDEASISQIPLTKTGYVRRFIRDYCFYGTHPAKNDYFKSCRYRRFIKELTLTVEEYSQLKKTFMGGYTHASNWWSGTTLYNVGSWDLSSSFPAVMFYEKFPMSKPYHINNISKEQFYSHIRKYNCCFLATFKNIRDKNCYEHYISESKCSICEGAHVENGRLIKADRIMINLTEVDWEIINQYYEWDKFHIDNFMYFKSAYLPKPILKAILDLYGKKTTLKGVEGKHLEYMLSKEMINSVYGMTVMDIIRDINEYDFLSGEWFSPRKCDAKESFECIKKNNEAYNRVLYYPWGVWVTAYARRNLFYAIHHLKGDYVYSDTDSVKILNYKKHEEFFNKLNKFIIKKAELSCEINGFDKGLLTPLTKDGIPKPLGVWEFEGAYIKFKTLGAKRYIYTDNKGLHITISGIKKSQGASKLSKLADPFGAFADGLTFYGSHMKDEDETGKLTMTYFDSSKTLQMHDYQGRVWCIHEKSYIHAEPADYKLTIIPDYLSYIESVGLSKNTNF